MAEGLIKSSRKTPTRFDHGYEPSFDSDGTPSCLSWSTDDVADWVEFLGFPEYRVSKIIASFRVWFLVDPSHHVTDN